MVSMVAATLSPVWRHYSGGLWLKESKPEVKQNAPYVQLKLPKKKKKKSSSLVLNYICLTVCHVFAQYTARPVVILMWMLCFHWVLNDYFIAPFAFLKFIIFIFKIPIEFHFRELKIIHVERIFFFFFNVWLKL